MPQSTSFKADVKFLLYIVCGVSIHGSIVVDGTNIDAEVCAKLKNKYPIAPVIIKQIAIKIFIIRLN